MPHTRTRFGRRLTPHRDLPTTYQRVIHAMRINILLDDEKSIIPIITDADTGKLIGGVELCGIELGPSIPPIARLVTRVAINGHGYSREEVVRAVVSRLDVTLSAPAGLSPCSKTHDATMVKMASEEAEGFWWQDVLKKYRLRWDEGSQRWVNDRNIPDDIGIRCFPPIPCNQVELTGVVFPGDLPPGLTEGATVVKLERDPVLPAIGWNAHLVALCDLLPSGATIRVPDASMVKVVAERCRNRNRQDLKVEVMA